MAVKDELRGAVAVGTAWCPAAGVPLHALAAGLAWVPLVGIGVGAVAVVVAEVAGRLGPALAGASGVLVLELIAGGRPRFALAATLGALGRGGEPAEVLARLRGRPARLAVGVALAALGLKLWAGAALGHWRTIALLVGPMLGRWAIVVQCHGGSPVHARGLAAGLVGRARFREFGWASVLAFGLTMALADGVGLAVVLAAALVTVALRLYVHHRLAGLTGRLLAATGELVETVVMLILAGFDQLKT